MNLVLLIVAGFCVVSSFAGPLGPVAPLVANRARDSWWKHNLTHPFTVCNIQKFSRRWREECREEGAYDEDDCLDKKADAYTWRHGLDEHAFRVVCDLQCLNLRLKGVQGRK